MKTIKRIFRFFGKFFIGVILAVCISVGVVAIIPKRKESIIFEVIKEDDDAAVDDTSAFL